MNWTFAIALSRLLLILLTTIGPDLGLSSIVRRNSVMEVANGRVEYVRKDLLSFLVRPGQVCKVQVEAEPMYQRVGTWTPEVFDCDYLPKSVRYEHNGSPFLREDVIKMNAYVLLPNETLQETVYFRISILNSRCDIIQINKVNLEVPPTSKVSNRITKDVMEFDYDRKFDTLCEVRILQNTLHEFPAHGQLVAPDNSSSPRELDRNAEYRLISSVRHPCDDFLLMGIRYEHLSPPTPDVDYIPIHVIVTDRRSGTVLQQERHWLPVRIAGAFPNQPPKASFSSMYIVEVDQFVLTNILPMAVSAMDGETRNEQLIFNITRQPEQGFIAHLSDHGKPIDSFWQHNVNELQIAYQPPNTSFTERRTFTMELVAYDAYFMESRPIRVLLSIRVAHTNAPRVSWNMGLTMLEGQSRVITRNCLQIVDKDNLHRVRFTLSGGLQHGRLYLNERPGFTFSWRDVENGAVTYRHDDTDTRKDFVSFRVTDLRHSTRFKIPISILPKDDAPPFLINNIVFQVQEGQVIVIHRFMLEASDADSAADYIRFNITVPPRAGEVQKKRSWDRGGWSVNTFQQKDLYNGLIHYKHLGGELFEDSFEFVLSDSCRPTPNVSPINRVTIKITPIDDLPPQPGTGNSLVLTVNETDVIHITSKELNFTDVEKKGSDVTYTVTMQCTRIGFDAFHDDAGKLINTDDMIMLMKDPNVQPTRTFTQRGINHLKVAYMPPMEDIGLHPVDIEFVVSASDVGGKAENGIRFSITILPVDNQTPRIQITPLNLNEGGTSIISNAMIQVDDDDTPTHGLTLVMSKAPRHGFVKNNNNILKSGDTFTMNDIKLLRVAYTHDNSENHVDSFELTVTDGRQNASITMPVRLQPIDDERPSLLDSNGPLTLHEGGSVVFTPGFLSATDTDSQDNNLIFEVLTPPNNGYITINGQTVATFMQHEVLSGKVRYTHNGHEIGIDPITDEVVIMVSDRRGQHAAFDEVLDTATLHFVILPVNSRPPRIALGRQVFRCNESGSQSFSGHFLMAEDVDSPLENLTFVITSSPRFGFIEDVTPRPGFEKVIGKPTDKFNYTQLMSGHIQYVQSVHRGIEPTSDRFSVCVTDGEYRSAEVPFLISIIPQNDEEPIFSFENVSCSEGEMAPLILSIEDLDVPHDHVMITISHPPVHGMVTDEMQIIERSRRSSETGFQIHPAGHHMEPIDEFSMDQLVRSKVLPAYMHDGSENEHDQFLIKISDGKHTMKKMMMVDVTTVNDERPIVQRNMPLTIELGETKVLSGKYLHTVDGDSKPVNLVYELHSTPRRGSLQIKTSTPEWRKMNYADTFSELDVELNKIRYKHESVLGSKSKDSFRFSVTDGEFTTPRMNFQIQIQHTKKSAVHVITNPIHINESQKVFITTHNLVARDDSNQPDEITFEVIRPPLFGQVEYVNFPDVPIEMFSQMDLLARNIVYIHKSKVDSPVDSFRILASNGLKTREADLNIFITSIDSDYPRVVINGGKAPDESSQNSANLMLYRDSTVVIGPSVITITDDDTPKSNIKLIITEFPQHGLLRLGEIQLNEENKEVFQNDIENLQFSYQHNGDKALIDRFSFKASDSIHNGYIINDKNIQTATSFYIKIENIDNTPPTLILNEEANTIQALGKGKLYAIHIDSHILKAEDAGTSLSTDLTFIVTNLPTYGHLKLIGNSDSVARFTQSDLDKRAVTYIISSKLEVTNDSFSFYIEDAWGNISPNNRFAMSWSRLKMSKTKLKICENKGPVSIGLERYGNTKVSSFISVTVKQSTAKMTTDFILKSALQVQFDPMDKKQSWTFSPVQDGIEERKEKFRIILNTPVNVVLHPRKRSCKIILLDTSHRKCTKVKKQKSKRKRNNKDRKKSRSRKRNNQLLPVKDDPSVTIQGKPNLVRYGKLGLGATVKPSTYFSNGSIRIWTYHGLLPVTIDETEEHSINLPQAKPIRFPINQPSTSNSKPNTLNDDPSIISHNLLYKGNLNVENSNASARIVVSGQSSIQSTLSPKVGRPKVIPKRCSLETKGQLYYDSEKPSLFKCNGALWLPWKPRRHTQNSQPKETCTKGWKKHDSWCYYVGVSAEGARMTWNSAQRQCRENYSANLVSIVSRKQLNWLWKLTKKKPFLIGLNRKLDQDSWEWANGEMLRFSNWKRNYPRDRRFGGMDCAIVHSRKRWIDISCSGQVKRTKYICMKHQ